MDVHMWTLEQELCKLADANDISQALCNLNLLETPDTPFSLDGDKDWIRGGAETYIYRFRLKKDNNGKEQEYIIKACIAYSPSSQLSDILEEWVKRRNTLGLNGIATPHLVGYGKGILIEEYIPHLFKDILQKNPSKLDVYLYQLAMYAGTLHRLNFSPMEPFADLRSRGEDLVAVDFGEDLGPQLTKDVDKNLVFDRLLCKLANWGITLSKADIAKMKSLYETEMNTTEMIFS